MLKASFLPQYTIWTIHLFSPLQFPHFLFLIFMEIRFLQPHSQHLTLPSLSCMNPLSLSSKLKPQSLSLLPRIRFRFYCTPLLLELSETEELIEAPNGRSSSRKNSRARVKVSDVQLKENWLSSLSCPPPAELEILGGDDVLLGRNDGSSCVIGIDPDVSGALAFLRTDHLGCCAQVFDSPYVQVPVGKRVRKRLDPRSIVQLVKSLDAPFGTVAYLEQSTPFPKDGKQGWWSGGFGYGLWIGILVSSGFSVVPVPSSVWKNEFELCGSRANKDSSRNLASELFPSLSSMLKRKKDHGRAEAVLIAAYGKRCRTKANEASIIAQELINSENCFANSC